ncbi:MAG: hypothetical protein RI947_751 [Candidatus Parcubacteria bacterium]|jgi:isopentenyl-diphosphate delta-isomerase
MDYYKKALYIPQVDEDDNVLGKVERWEAHKKGILHRGFTVALVYKGRFICQHRKHPVFDGVIDLTASSHPLYTNKTIQTIPDAATDTLKREWNIDAASLSPLTFKGKVIYSSFDGTYTEHELCHFYMAETDTLPTANLDFSYGFSLLTVEDFQKSNAPLMKALAPWVREALNAHIL